MPITVLFRTQLRPDLDTAQYEAHANQLLALASALPGFIEAKDFIGTDGERLALITWRSEEDLARWRDHPVHRLAQEKGRTDYYARYHLSVCRVLRTSAWPASDDETKGPRT